MVSYYGYDVIGSRWSSHLWVKMNVFSPSFNNKSKACGWNDAKGFIRLFYMRSPKTSVYCGFNLISNSWSNPRWRPRWRPLLLSSQAKSFWNTATYQNLRGRVPLIPTPRTTVGVWGCVYVRRLSWKCVSSPSFSFFFSFTCLFIQLFIEIHQDKSTQCGRINSFSPVPYET